MKQKIEDIYRVIIQNHAKDNKIGLLTGKGSLVLFLFYYHRLTLAPKAFDLAFLLLEEIMALINQGEADPGFCNGIAGVGWLVEHLENNEFIECDTNSLLNDMDNYIYESAINDLKGKEYDFLHAALGKALYLVTRKKINQSYLEEIAKQMLRLSESPVENQLRWKSPYKSPLQPEYNLSLSHGITSIINFFSRLYKLNIAKTESHEIISKSINFLLSFQSVDQLSIFPNKHILNKPKNSISRLAWCYGDLGIGITLWQAAKIIDDKELENKSIEILLHSSKRRDLKENLVIDAGLCHGTAGIAHIFNRMHLNTRKEEFKYAADYWFNETVKMAKFKDGVAGYKSWQNRHSEWQNDISFLEGIAGIGLALISAVSDIEPKWDESLLLS